MVLAANRTEPDWEGATTAAAANDAVSGGRFMGKSNNPNRNPNPNPKLSKKRNLQQQQQQQQQQQKVIYESPDDASSINRRPSWNDSNTGQYVTFNVSLFSKHDLVELKKRLNSELDQIRKLKNQIEVRPIGSSGSNLSKKRKKGPSGSGVLGAENVKLMKQCGQILSKLMRHKLGYWFNTPVDVVGLQLHDYYDVIKCPMDLGTVKSKLGRNEYDSSDDFAADVRLTFNNAIKYNPKGHEVYVLAEELLARFEELYLPIKENIGEGNNYGNDINGDEVALREETGEVVLASSWDHDNEILVDRFRDEEAHRVRHEEVHGVRNEEAQLLKLENTGDTEVIIGSGLNQNLDSDPNLNVAVDLPVRTPSPVRAPPVKPVKQRKPKAKEMNKSPSPVRAPSVKPVKQPKPKARDPNKREMSLHEKHLLSVGLQSLPPEKLEQVVQIIRKRNGHLKQEGDEIELDIEAVDNETLWELDRFVINYKKLVSKIKRQSLMGININNEDLTASEGNKDGHTTDGIANVGNKAKKPRKAVAGDEDVDIVDDMPTSSFPHVEIENDNGRASSSSHSSRDSSDSSSSSSGSDSGSSSGSDSENATV